MRYHEIIIRKHYRHEPYHDVSGYEFEVKFTGEELPSWVSEESFNRDYEEAVETMERLANMYKKEYGLKDIEKTKSGLLRAVDWYSIGD